MRSRKRKSARPSSFKLKTNIFHTHQDNKQSCTTIFYLPTPWSRVLLEKLTGSQLVKKFSIFYGTRRCITAFTRARHLSIFSARSIQSMPPSHFLKIQFNIILPSTPGSSKWSLFLRFPPKTLHAPLLSHTCYMLRPSHSSRFDYPEIFGEAYRSLSSSLCSFLHSPVTSSS